MSFRIHKEGRALIPLSWMTLLVLWIGFYSLSPILGYILAIPGLITAFIILYFFRNPQVHPPQDPHTVLSPCNGKVVVIEEVEDSHYFQGPVIQLSIFMSPLDVHVNRNPIGGKVEMIKYFPGKYLMAFNPKSSQLNEQNLIVTANEHLTVAYKQIAGFLARRIKWYVEEGDRVGQGQEYGFIRFGSRIDVLLPLDCEIEVALGTKVKAGQSILARVKTEEV
ncbi:MAG: phosphatidylserine decarboxylase family protein [Bacteroidota bacterium]